MFLGWIATSGVSIWEDGQGIQIYSVLTSRNIISPASFARGGSSTVSFVKDLFALLP